MNNKMKLTIRIIYCFACIIIIGFVSNYISLSKCNKVARHSIETVISAEAPAKGKIINWIEPEYLTSYKDDSGWRPHTLREYLYYIYLSKQIKPINYNSKLMPWGYIDPHPFEVPFIIKQYYGWMAGSLWGRGGAKIYLSLFGAVFELCDYKIWVS